MYKCLTLAKRNVKEMVREPLSAVFCIGFPLVMLFIMQFIFTNMKAVEVPSNFEISSYASGICVFGYTFLSMFVAMQIASDKNTAFIKRIDISPISKFVYYFGYCISALPMALVQTLLFFLVALCFGFPFDGKFFLNIVYLLPSAAFYIAVGVLVGCVCKNEKQTGPISSIIVSLTGMLGGVFMPVNAMGGGFKTFVDILPFVHTVSIGAELQTSGAACVYPHILLILGYILAVCAVIFAIEKVRAVKK